MNDFNFFASFFDNSFRVNLNNSFIWPIEDGFLWDTRLSRDMTQKWWSSIIVIDYPVNIVGKIVVLFTIATIVWILISRPTFRPLVGDPCFWFFNNIKWCFAINYFVIIIRSYFAKLVKWYSTGITIVVGDGLVTKCSDCTTDFGAVREYRCGKVPPPFLVHQITSRMNFQNDQLNCAIDFFHQLWPFVVIWVI